MKIKTLIACLSISGFLFNGTIAQQQNPVDYPDSLSKFHTDESWFITKKGCAILLSEYYCMSDGCYYFAVGDKKNYQFIDTNEVIYYHNVEIGKDQMFSLKKYSGLTRRIWVGTVVIIGPPMILIIGGVVLYVGYEVWEIGNSSGAIGGWFGTGLAMGATAFYYAFKSAIKKVRAYDAFRVAKNHSCT